MDTTQWPQEGKAMGEVVNNETTCSKLGPLIQKEVQKEQVPQALNCPRCNSINTKFCYYNNYSLTQPRYLCKTCRRYWTAGGTLRNVPVGGGSRKNKRPSPSSSSSSSNPTIKIPDHLMIINPPNTQNPNNNKDLNLAFPIAPQNFHQFVKLPKTDHQNENINHYQTTTPPSSSRGLNSFLITPPMPIDSNVNTTPMLFPLQEFIPVASSGFSGDHNNHGFGGIYGGVQENNNNNMMNGGRLMFPFTATTTTTAASDHQAAADHNNHNNKGGQPNSVGYWTGILGGGSW